MIESKRGLWCFIALAGYSLAGLAIEPAAGPWLDVYREPSVSISATSSQETISSKKFYAGTKFLKSSQRVQTLPRQTITASRQSAALSFFQSPVILPDGSNLLNYAAFDPATQDVDLYKITYRSVNIKNKPTILSGLVAVPTDAAGGDASGGIVVHMHATIMQRQNVPSERSVEAYGAITAFGGENRISPCRIISATGSTSCPIPTPWAN